MSDRFLEIIRPLFATMEASRQRAEAVVKEMLPYFTSETVPEWSGVYILRSDASVKIGETSNLRVRMRDLQAANPVRLIIMHFEPHEDKKLRCARELQLHRAFAHLHKHNEWFRFECELAAFVRGDKT